MAFQNYEKDIPWGTFSTSKVTIPKANVSDSRVERPEFPSLIASMLKSSGATHRWDPLNPDAEVSVQLRLAILMKLKPLSRAHPDLSTRILF